MAPRGGAKIKHALPSKRTSTGALSLKTKAPEEGRPSRHQGEVYRRSLVTPSGNIVYHSYSSTLAPPSSPSPCFTIVGIRKPEGGYGKALKPKLTPKEKEQAESSSQQLRIKRVRKPTTVQRPPAPFESDEEE